MHQIISFFLYIILFLHIANAEVKHTSASDIEKYYNTAKRNFKIHPDSCERYVFKAYQLSEKYKEYNYQSLSAELIAKYYTTKENYSEATRYYLIALNIEEKFKNKKRIADLFDGMGSIYYYMEKYEKSKQYSLQALKIYELLHDTLSIAKVYNHLGALNCSREYCENRNDNQKQYDFKIALNHYQKALKLYASIHDTAGIANIQLNIGAVLNKQNKPNDAIVHIYKALNFYEKTGNWNGESETYFILGRSYCVMKLYNKSADAYKKSELISLKHNYTQGIQFLYEEMAHTYDMDKNYKQARDYYIKYMIIRDSIYNNEKSRQIFEFDAKYQTAKKEKAILALNLEKRNKNLIIIILISAFVFAILVSIIILTRQHSLRVIALQEIEIKEQRINQLEKDRQLLATQSVLQGEETERQRMARDLHDGLGGLLSGVKLELNNMKGNVILSEDSVHDFDRAIELLDTSIKELRRVAHNMMPEALIKFGLKDTLSDFCQNLNEVNPMEIKFQFLGNFMRVDNKLEINAFRILQELINNAIKHSQASTLVIQMIQETNRLCFIVSDNGIGFDAELVKLFKGIGLSNIRSRVESMNGLLDVYSKPGEGSEFTIEFAI